MDYFSDFSFFEFFTEKDIAFFVALFVFVIVAKWKIYEKAGQAGWAAIIPFYNFFILLKIVGKPDWWILLLFVPIVNIVIGIYVIHLLSKSFGHDIGFTLGLIFLGFIFYPILGFGDSKYLGPVGVNYA